MALISPDALRPPQPQPRFALFALGFRPLFLLAALSAVVLMLAWLWSLMSVTPLSSYYGLTQWHAHEMVFGYGMAVIGGFLLTAARNWTGIDTLSRTPLALLSLVWLLGRVLPLVGAPIPDLVVAGVDLLYLPLLALALSRPLIKAGQWNNIAFLPILWVGAIGNLLIHLQLLGYSRWGWDAGLSVGIGTIALILVMMGGRVIPFFIERGVGGDVVARRFVWVERLAIPVMVVGLLAAVVLPSHPLAALLLVVAGGVHLLRTAGWYQRGVWANPLLWVLFIGYGWFALSLLLMGLAQLGWFDPVIALHAMTVGGVGVTTMGMMARVSLGHSGRVMQAHPLTTIAFVLVVLAALMRVVGPLVAPAQTLLWIDASGLIWATAFLLFLIVYLPIYLRPRIDGRPG